MSLHVIPISPIQQLTDDVLWHIFEYAATSDALRGPTTISHVCRLWRLLALDSPFIWSSITIRLNTATISQNHLLQLDHFFKRSQNVPVNLTILATRIFEVQEKNELLRPNADRFRSLYIKASDGSVANLLWMQLDMRMPRLEKFDTIIADTSHVSTTATLALEETNKIIPPVSSDSLVCWELWSPRGLTTLTLETVGLWNKPDLDDIYHLLATTCHTLQHFEYLGAISSIDDAQLNRNHLNFSELCSLSISCDDNMVPLIQLMIIPQLKSLTLRDFVAHPAATPAAELMADIDNDTVMFDPDDVFQVIKQWTTVSRLEIYGIDEPFDDLSQRPELSEYLESLNDLSSLVLYGIGAATSVAYTLFMNEKPLLPNLSRFLLAISPNTGNDLCDYLIMRQRHRLSHLQKLSINFGYFRQLSNLNRMGVLWESSDNIFVIADPEVGKFIPIEEERLLRHE